MTCPVCNGDLITIRPVEMYMAKIHTCKCGWKRIDHISCEYNPTVTPGMVDAVVRLQKSMKKGR